jgi:hypothetical protein
MSPFQHWGARHSKLSASFLIRLVPTIDDEYKVSILCVVDVNQAICGTRELYSQHFLSSEPCAKAVNEPGSHFGSPLLLFSLPGILPFSLQDPVHRMDHVYSDFIVGLADLPGPPVNPRHETGKPKFVSRTIGDPHPSSIVGSNCVL